MESSTDPKPNLIGLSENQRRQIANALDGKGAKLPCPRCGTDSFTVGDGYFVFMIQQNLKMLKLSGEAIPAISVICDNCGFISQHAIGVLGFSPSEGVPKDE